MVLIQTQSSWRRYGLHGVAVQSASTDVAKALIAAGADVERKNKEGKTAEMLAVENGHQNLAELLRRAVKKR